MYARLDDGFFDHPKVLETSLAALGLHALALSYTARHLTDGWLTRAAVLYLGRGDHALAAVEELVALKLWDKDGPGYRIHDYLEVNWSRAEIESMRKGTRERVRAFRARSNAVPTRVTNGERNAFVPGLGKPSPSRSRALRQNPEEPEQEKASSTTLRQAADANRSKPEAMLILEINRLAGTKFRLGESHLRFARGRLREYAYPELVAMLAWRWRTWDAEQRRQWFRPETLLNETKCGSYMGQYDAATPRPARPVSRAAEIPDVKPDRTPQAIAEVRAIRESLPWAK